jgi:hypothetical protein
MNNPLWSRSPARSTVRWAATLPLLLVGSMLFWTMALGSGAMSLLAVTGFAEIPRTSDDLASDGALSPTAAEPMPGQVSDNPILVHLQESIEPEDVNDNIGAVAPMESDDDGNGRLPAQGQPQ